jgi:hypothetical protein
MKISLELYGFEIYENYHMAPNLSHFFFDQVWISFKKAEEFVGAFHYNFLAIMEKPYKFF